MGLSVRTVILYILHRVASGERIRGGRYDDERVDPTESRRNASEIVRDLSRDPEVCVFSQILETIDFRSSRGTRSSVAISCVRSGTALNKKPGGVLRVYSGNLNNGITARFSVMSDDATRRRRRIFQPAPDHFACRCVYARGWSYASTRMISRGRACSSACRN